MEHSWPLFLCFRLFNTCSYKILPLTGFELRTSGVGNDFSANEAQLQSNLLFFVESKPLEQEISSTVSVWPEKNRQMSTKVPKNDFTRKNKDFDTITKIAWECRRFGQINCCQRVWKLIQSAINRPIWSHWWLLSPYKKVFSDLIDDNGCGREVASDTWGPQFESSQVQIEPDLPYCKDEIKEKEIVNGPFLKTNKGCRYSK